MKNPYSKISLAYRPGAILVSAAVVGAQSADLTSKSPQQKVNLGGEITDENIGNKSGIANATYGRPDPKIRVEVSVPPDEQEKWNKELESEFDQLLMLVLEDEASRKEQMRLEQLNQIRRSQVSRRTYSEIKDSILSDQATSDLVDALRRLVALSDTKNNA